MKRRPFLGLLGWLALSSAAGPASPFPHFSGRQAGPDHRSAFLAVGLSRLAPAFVDNYHALLAVLDDVKAER